MQGAAPAAQPSSQQQAAMMNSQGRAILLGSGIKMSRIVAQGAALALGSATRINLNRTGITTGVLLDFTCSLNITGAMTASPAGPWTLISQLKYTDFAGTDRINTPGYALYALNSLKHNQMLSNAIAGVISSIGNLDTDLLTFPTAIANPALLQFSLFLPFAVDPSRDLRGAVPSMTNVGEHYITITPALALVNTTDVLAAPYTAGTAAVNSFTVDVTQFYIQPQNLAANMLPGIDLTTIYEINGNWVTTSGFQSNSQVLINYPNDRSIMSALHVYENGGLLTVNGADLSKLELLVNSNTVFREHTPRSWRLIQRDHIRGDVPAGFYYWNHRSQPILTALYATVQARYSLLTVNAGVTKIVAQYESTYPSGQPLSGISPNAG